MFCKLILKLEQLFYYIGFPEHYIYLIIYIIFKSDIVQYNVVDFELSLYLEIQRVQYSLNVLVSRVQSVQYSLNVKLYLEFRVYTIHS